MFRTATSELVFVMNDTNLAFGNDDPAGLPLLLDRSLTIVALTSKTIGGSSVVTNVSASDAQHLVRHAGRLVSNRVSLRIGFVMLCL